MDLSAHTSLKGAYLVPQSDAEFVTVQLLVHVGEADFDGPEGLAHYLEHLVWYSANKAHNPLKKKPDLQCVGQHPDDQLLELGRRGDAG